MKESYPLSSSRLVVLLTVRRKPVLIAFLLYFFVFSVFAQEQPYQRPRTYDVQNYTIRLNFDRAKKIVHADTTVTLTPLSSPLSEVDLDAESLDFSSVTLDPGGKQLVYKASGGKVAVQLDHTYQPAEIANIRFKYDIKDPKKGIYFISARTTPDPKDRRMIPHPAEIWSQNEPEDARYWIPSFDYPSDKATSEEFITAPKGEDVIGNGVLIDTKPNADGTKTFHYKMDVPHSTYLISFVVGDFARLSDKYKTVPLAFYAYKGSQHAAGAAFAQTKDLMAVYESLTGIPFPYKKYDQVMVSGFEEFDGMENITATTLADNEIAYADLGFQKGAVEDLVAHELAHSWFGDLVTCRNWSELWLNEGFATYMEAASREKLFGRENYINKLEQDRDLYFLEDIQGKKRHALQNLSAKPDNSLFDLTTYLKGGVVIHMLRETVGTEAFWKGINIYLTRHKFDSVVSSDLESALEEASGKDLKSFFDEWVYAGGYPKLEIEQNYDAAAGVLHLKVDQTQKEDGITPAAFRFPLDIEITTKTAPVTETLDITKRSEVFDVKVASPPTGLKVDPREKVILKVVKIKQP